MLRLRIICAVAVGMGWFGWIDVTFDIPEIDWKVLEGVKEYCVQFSRMLVISILAS